MKNVFMSNSPYKHNFTRYNKINKIKGHYPQKGEYLKVINITSTNVMDHNIRYKLGQEGT